MTRRLAIAACLTAVSCAFGAYVSHGDSGAAGYWFLGVVTGLAAGVALSLGYTGENR